LHTQQKSGGAADGASAVTDNHLASVATFKLHLFVRDFMLGARRALESWVHSAFEGDY